MRKILIGTLLTIVFAAKSNAAILLGCGSGEDFVNTHILFKTSASKGTGSFICHTIQVDKKEKPSGLGIPTGLSIDRTFNVYIHGVGLGLYGTLAEGFLLTCPSVRGKAMGRERFVNKNGKVKKGVTKFYGVEAKASAIIGGHVGVFANKNGGVCLLTGITTSGIGASLAGVKLEIEDLE
jgi:hypothetical protein